MQLGSSSISSPSLTSSPTRDERRLAAIAHVPWLLVPLLVYVYRRRDSRFVAQHALRAALLHAAILPLGTLVATLSGIQLVSLRLFGGAWLLAIGAWTMWISWILTTVGYWVFLGLAALAAYRGRPGDEGRIGALTGRLLVWDRGVPPA